MCGAVQIGTIECCWYRTTVYIKIGGFLGWTLEKTAIEVLQQGQRLIAHVLLISTISLLNYTF